RMHMRLALKFHPDEPEVMFFAALVENQLGNKAGAIQWLGKALHQGYSLAEINAAVDFDNLRPDPVFQAMVQATGQKGYDKQYAGWYMSKKPDSFEVACPCCGAMLKVDSASHAVIAHIPPERPKTFNDFEEAARAMKEEDS